MMNLEPLKDLPGYVYLATPYSRYPAGKVEAHRMACVLAGSLIKAKIPTFCPIAHSHAIAQIAGIDPDSHEIWLPADQFFIDGAYGIVVALMRGWQESTGVQYEIAEFKKAHKPIFYLDPEMGVISPADVSWAYIR